MKHEFHIKFEIDRDFTVEEKSELMKLFEESLNNNSNPLLKGGDIRVWRTPSDREIADALVELDKRGEI